MFERIVKINDRGAEIKLTSAETEVNLLGLHLVFENGEKKVVCEIDSVIEDIVEAHFIGEIIDNKFYNGVIHKPDTNSSKWIYKRYVRKN